MKKYLSFIVFILALKTVAAQDTLIKTNGVATAVKILEISVTDIKYKKFNFLDGPTYIENKADIRTIIFSNGTREEVTAVAAVPAPLKVPPAEYNVDYYGGPVTPKYKILNYGSRFMYNNHTIGERELHHVLQDTKDKEILALVQTSKDAHKLKFIGFAAIPLGIASLVVLSKSVNMYGQVSNDKLATSALLLCGAIACPIVSGVYAHRRTLSNRKAIKLYNERY